MPKHLASRNASRIRAVLDGAASYGDIYRTAVGGPSGQRRDVFVGRIHYIDDGPNVLEIHDRNGIYGGGVYGDAVGYASRRVYEGEYWWSISAETDDGHEWLGYARTLSVGMDVLLHGEFAATGNHDSHRISQSRFVSFRQFQPTAVANV